MKLSIPFPSSLGLILSYQCSNECRHCLYASSPAWREWITEENLEKILSGLSKYSRFLTGIHLAGGEPFLRPDAVFLAIKKIKEYRLPLDYVETNAFWCRKESETEAIFSQANQLGLRAILISASPFHVEFIPMDRVNRAVEIGRKIFGPQGVLIYTEYFYNELQALEPEYSYSFTDYLRVVGREHAALRIAQEYSLIPNGRAAVRLVDLYQRYSASHFFSASCEKELTSPFHLHIDLYGNYIAGLCAGISLGNAFDLDRLFAGVELENHLFLSHITKGMESLYCWAVEQFDYEELQEGYIAKCHLCLDIRRHIVKRGIHFKELAPLEFYAHLED